MHSFAHKYIDNKDFAFSSAKVQLSQNIKHKQTKNNVYN